MYTGTNLNTVLKKFSSLTSPISFVSKQINAVTSDLCWNWVRNFTTVTSASVIRSLWLASVTSTTSQLPTTKASHVLILIHCCKILSFFGSSQPALGLTCPYALDPFSAHRGFDHATTLSSQCLRGHCRKLFQRQYWGKFWEMGWSAEGLFQVHGYRHELNQIDGGWRTVGMHLFYGRESHSV